MTAVDWAALQSLATKVMASAYPPYSDFPAVRPCVYDADGERLRWG